MTGARLGRDAVLYLNTGTWGSPTWAAIPQVSDLTVSAPWDEANADTRESPVGMTLGTMMRLQVSGRVKFVIGDTNMDTIFDAMVARTALDFMVLNAASTVDGARGYRFKAQVSAPSEDQGLGVPIFPEILIKPTPHSDGAPQSVEVASGAPVFTTIA